MGLKGARLGEPASNDTQRTALQAVARKQQFSFKIYFENLTSVELGALDTAIRLPQSFFGAATPVCHQLGMGKPFGMGVIRLKSELYAIERDARYKDLFSGWGMKSEPISTAYADDFKQFINNLGLTKHDERIRNLQTMLTLYENDAELEYMSHTKSKDRYRLDKPTEVSPKLTRSPNNAEKEIESAGKRYNVAEIGATIRGKAIHTDEEGIWFVPANMENKEEEYDALIPNSEVIKWVKDDGRVKGEIIRIEDRERTTFICKQLED